MFVSRDFKHGCVNIVTLALRKKCPYSELFCSVFSPNAGKYGQNNSKYGHFLHSVRLRRGRIDRLTVEPTS